MRVNSVDNNTYLRHHVKNNGKVSSFNSNPIVTSKTTNLVRITFTGGDKNMKQLASFTPENNGLGLPEAAQGGEGKVGFEVVKSMRDHEGIDARSFMPFWEHNNPKGGFKFLIHKKSDFPDGVSKLPDEIPDKFFYSADVGEDLNAVAKKLKIQPDELSYVIQSRPNGTGADAKSRYCLLDATSISGEVKRPSSGMLGELDTIPYKLFKISDNNKQKYFKLGGTPNYFVYTPDLARASKPYSYDCWGNVPFEAEIVNSDWMRAMADFLHSKMNTEEFGYYDPANVFAHDRPGHTYGVHLANMSASGNEDVNGLKVHIWDHNTGRNYQGVTGEMMKFIPVVGNSDDVEALKQMPDFELLKKAQSQGMGSLSGREQQIVKSIIGPYLLPFRDGAGTYNIIKTGISAAETNPDNISIGTVSHTFDAEMKSPETPDAAKFLTTDYARIKTQSVCNGVTPQSMEFDNPEANFGRGGNGLSAKKSGFTTFKYDPEKQNIEEVIAAKEKNAKWLTNLIWEAGEKGQDELNKLFFNKGQIADGHNILGYLSPIKDGEILVFGFGRPDEQKGFNISTKGYLTFLQDKSIPKEMKSKVKVMLGAGPWNKEADDYKEIVHDLNEIQKLDNGAYKHNIMYIDGFTPNRITGACHYGLFTSRREMCGITPIECKIAGTPYGTTATGGPVDYTNSKNGFLTKDAVELRPERFGLSWDNSAWEIDRARVNHQAPQVADIFKAMIYEYTNDRASYVAKSKKNIEELVDWHNNSEYNYGKSANKCYLEDILEVDQGWGARNKSRMRRVTGQFGQYQEQIEEMMKQSKSKPVKVILGIVAGGLAIAGGVYMLVHKSEKNNSTKEKQINAAA